MSGSDDNLSSITKDKVKKKIKKNSQLDKSNSDLTAHHKAYSYIG